MSGVTKLVRGIKSGLTTVPKDVLTVVLFVSAANIILSLWPTESVRAAVGLPVLFLSYGYTFTALLFPRQHTTRQGSESALVYTVSQRQSHLSRLTPTSWWERIALSAGASVTLIPITGLIVAPLAGSLSGGVVLLTLNLSIGLCAIGGTIRRNAIPVSERLQLPRPHWGRIIWVIRDGEGFLNRFVPLVLLVSVLVATATMGFVLFAPIQNESYTSVSVLAENASGELVASGYPNDMSSNESSELVVRIENQEGIRMTYTVVGVIQRLEHSSNAVMNTERVLERHGTVRDGNSWKITHSFTPTLEEDNLRVSYFVYHGEPPANPSSENAYREVYFWVEDSDVTTGSALDDSRTDT